MLTLLLIPRPVCHSIITVCAHLSRETAAGLGQEELETEDDFQPIEKLQSVGINNGVCMLWLCKCVSLASKERQDPVTRHRADGSIQQASFAALLCNTGDIKKAKEAGYHTIMSFIIHPTKVCSLLACWQHCFSSLLFEH